MKSRTLKHLLEYLAFMMLVGIVLILPLKAVQRLARGLGSLAYRILPLRRAITLDNLTKGMPELSPERRVQVARGVFQSVTTAFLEMLWLPRFTAEKLRAFAPVEDPHLLQDTRDKGKGVVFLTAHFGNWEIVGQTVSVNLGAPVLIIVKPQSNPYVGRAIAKRRTQFGARVVPMGESVRPVIQALRAGETVALAGDQSATRQSVWADFFGREVPVHQGPAAFALRTRSDMVLAFAVRQPDGTYRTKLQRVDYDDLADYTPENVEELTRRHVRQTEAVIREHPEQWMWTHRRWKTGPDEKPGTRAHGDAAG